MTPCDMDLKHNFVCALLWFQHLSSGFFFMCTQNCRSLVYPPSRVWYQGMKIVGSFAGDTFDFFTAVDTSCIPDIHRKMEEIIFTEGIHLGLKKKKQLVDLFLRVPTDQHIESIVVVDHIVLSNLNTCKQILYSWMYRP